MPLNEPPTEYNLTAGPASDSSPARQPTRPLDDLKHPPAASRSLLNLTALFVFLGGGLVIGTILQQPDPSYCPNDASRWNTVYYLVQHGTYEYLPDHGAWWNTKQSGPFRDRLPFWTIDMVAKKGEDGTYHYYSSKPPLLPTIAAGIVLTIEKTSDLLKPVLVPALERITGDRGLVVNACKTDGAKDGSSNEALGDSWIDFRIHRWFVMRTTLIILQAIPFMIFVWLIARYMREATESTYARYFCIAVAALGTYLTPWSITFNNHVIGAFTGLFALFAAMRVWYDARREWYWFTLAGFFAALAATMELPAASLTAVVLLMLLVKDWRRTLAYALVPAILPVAALLYTNYLAMGTFMPAYADFGKAGGLYDYPDSYWMPLPTTGMDGLAEPKRIYLLHLLIGHHGFFFLTPILLVALLGMGRHLRHAGIGPAFLVSVVLLAAAGVVIADARMDGALIGRFDETTATLLPDHPFYLPRGYVMLAPLALLLLINIGMYLPAPARPRPVLALLVLVISAVVIGYYTFKTNNYGGGVQGARWLFWLIPLWLLMLPAGIEWIARRLAGRAICYSLLLISMITVAFALRQPWSDSWAHILFRNMGWIQY
ncbi:MAG TPA: hypothetical protein PKG54_15845 [Phycisphaerae bacterium]|jgi:hypothetical protein|nr:hypothetical protein [Phycisphaerae bacterium]HOB75987.1 hypothetical protein [Phycisphaerae bacterium]HOJ55860.1 hypothetical protein [Phycisphaerae bacterium]HOL27833.1 hypothetical protein [Phycisphaerae bacterium]HPP22238.1 hypothetical protein [Phycisphaerae bacterium]